ncbi:MAG: DNA-protecting protein DprA [Candidatus Bathyarchaeota archaeon]|nr:DNA-protecting protein DprA [Candidatus Bathyarchaeum tardum]
MALQEKRWIFPPETLQSVYSETETLEDLWKGDSAYLSHLGLNDITINNFIEYRNNLDFKKYKNLIKTINQNSCKLIKYVDKEYPNRLRNLKGGAHLGSPLVLIHKGSVMNFDNNVAIVGTRECSHYGHMMARQFARELAKKGYTIVSGLARGIDTEAHCGALEAKQGKTIAVLAWMRPIYPKENEQLAKDIEKNGALISENYFKSQYGGGRLQRAMFVDRNRITSGISKCLIAIEAGSSSGTVHQVRLSLKQGRKVFALKPKPENKKANEGFNEFLKMGATPISSLKPVLNFLASKSIGNKLEEKSLEEYIQN